MRAGARDRLIVIQVKTVARDGVGEAVESWANLRTVWAQRMEGSAVTERFAAQQRFAEVTTIFRVGYWPAYADISVDTHRVMYESRPYNILGAIEIGRKDGVELVCVARGEKP
jgi:SPP1 family predicted phage head-tail adaptor